MTLTFHSLVQFSIWQNLLQTAHLQNTTTLKHNTNDFFLATLQSAAQNINYSKAIKVLFYLFKMNLNNNTNRETPVEDRFSVYLGRGNGVSQKVGNRIYRQLIKSTKPIYRQARGNKAKAKVASDLIMCIQRHGGTFYHQNEQKSFVESPSQIIELKVKQALREKYKSQNTIKNDYSNPKVQSILNHTFKEFQLKNFLMKRG